MTKVFIGGSRRISRLSGDVKRRIDRIIDKRLPIIVGDANGADRCTQAYLRSRHYDLVEIFCTGDSCRNNAGPWPVRSVSGESKRRDFSFYALKDRAMANEASLGLMLWDGKSVGTLMNVLRLSRQQKKVVVYVAPERQFFDVKDASDWELFLSRCVPELRRRVKKEASAEQADTGTSPQSTLLF